MRRTRHSLHRCGGWDKDRTDETMHVAGALAWTGRTYSTTCTDNPARSSPKIAANERMILQLVLYWCCGELMVGWERRVYVPGTRVICLQRKGFLFWRTRVGGRGMASSTLDSESKHRGWTKTAYIDRQRRPNRATVVSSGTGGVDVRTAAESVVSARTKAPCMMGRTTACVIREAGK